MKKYLNNIFVRYPQLVLIGPLSFMQTEQHPVDNLTILNRLASNVVNTIVDQLAPDSSVSYIIRSQNQSGASNWWLENWFVKGLSQRGVSRIYLNQSVSTNELVIEFKILSLGVKYIPTSENDLLKREFNLRFDIRAFEGTSGLVKLVNEFTRQFEDSITVDELSELEHKDFPFTQAKLPPKKSYHRYVEPLIVLTTTSAIIYLFFRLRSK